MRPLVPLALTLLLAAPAAAVAAMGNANGAIVASDGDVQDVAFGEDHGGEAKDGFAQRLAGTAQNREHAVSSLLGRGNARQL